MAFFGVDKDSLHEVVSELQGINIEINGIIADASSTAVAVSRNPSLNKLGYDRMIREAILSTEKNAEAISVFSSRLERIANIYDSYENHVIASSFDESSKGDGSTLSFGGSQDGQNPFFGYINEDGGASGTKKSDVVKAFLDYLKEVGSNEAGNYFGLLGGFAGFYGSWMDLFSGNCEYGAKKTYFDLSKNSVDTWKSMYDIFANHFSYGNDFGTGIYSRVGQTAAGAFGLTASTAGIVSTVNELINTQHQNGWDTAGDWIAKLTDSSTDFGKDAYE